MSKFLRLNFFIIDFLNYLLYLVVIVSYFTFPSISFAWNIHPHRLHLTTGVDLSWILPLLFSVSMSSLSEKKMTRQSTYNRIKLPRFLT